MYKLIVLITQNCNFACKHCIVLCAYNKKSWVISDEHIGEIASYINSNSQISEVNFSGGEPTLYIDKIKKIQNLISREVRYSLTTNGLLCIKNKEIFEPINLDKIIFSLDKHHDVFIKAASINKISEYYLEKGLEVEINFVYDSLDEFELLESFRDPRLKVVSSRIISKTNRKSSPDLMNVFNTGFRSELGCPSLRQHITEAKGEAYQNLMVYVPEKGLSPCCGPLMFHGLISDNILFSKTNEDFNENQLRKIIMSTDFSSSLSKLNDLDMTSCEVCSLLMTENKEEPSLVSLWEQKDQVGYYNYEKLISFDKAKFLNRKFEISYFHLLEADKLKSSLSSEGLISSDISIKIISQEDADTVVNFVIENYYKAHSEYYDENDIQQAKVDFPAFFKAFTPSGKMYFKNGKMVAQLLVNRYPSHPSIKEQTVHIGYWGYNRDTLEIDEARSVKKDWVEFIRSYNSDNLPIDVSVDFFNEKALKWVNQLGFKQIQLRLDKRPTP